MANQDRPASVVLPIAASFALGWLQGKYHDADLVLSRPAFDCTFLVNVPCQAAWRDAVQRILWLRAQGCKFLVTRTGIESVERHLLHAGATATLREIRGDEIKRRFILMPTQFELYFGRLARSVKF
jgi:hypothetical protein